MDIFEQWHKIEEEKFNHSPIKKEDIMEAIYQKSTGTMEALKVRLKYKMVWILLFTACFAGLLIWQINNTPVAIIFGFAALLYGLGFVGLRSHYLKMGSERKEDSTIGVMKQNYKMIQGALKFEMNIFLGILPFMLFGAMIVPSLITGTPLIEVATDTELLIVFAVAIVILLPLVKFVSGRMNKLAYGSFINRLETNIKEMEKIG